MACICGDCWRRVGGNDLSPESSLMMARMPMRDGALGGELLLATHVGCWTSSRLHMKTGSLSLMGCGVLTCGGFGSVGGTLSRSSVCVAPGLLRDCLEGLPRLIQLRR